MNKEIAAELDQIRKAHGGLLLPAEVVEFARNPETALHGRFTWEDSEAARRYRLMEAREVIRVHVTVIGDDPNPVRAFVSLSDDRENGGGYRAIEDVVNSPERHAQLLADALDDLRIVRRKYERLNALKPVWQALEGITQKVA